ncbi:apolipoprotein D and lipocalin family protein [Jatrophihabitans sp. GAS493]|uniref:lipocalin family protein n=1 Tax=Jatrophihabitans sp. GAS493 TaxID=1907575 RepID=UPI000BC09B84|nr:lipocalin family protein [Jatrophihabitans sp. GAS493]SOD72313.1 apolipoprotein D and lipocalin family protein [Jatrophihabitans sp. GAS493]
MNVSALALLALLPICSAQAASAQTTQVAASTGAVQPVASVDLTRYVGSWYQVAAIPQIFEVQCAANSTAVYTARSDGTVGVDNTCTTWWGSVSQVLGVARIENKPANSVLTVSFLNLFGQQLFFGGPNYEIVGLDSGYRWAVVVSPDRGSAFVLSRTPALSSAATAAVRAVLTRNGISPCALMTTPQAGGIGVSKKFC